MSGALQSRTSGTVRESSFQYGDGRLICLMRHNAPELLCLCGWEIGGLAGKFLDISEKCVFFVS